MTFRFCNLIVVVCFFFQMCNNDNSKQLNSRHYLSLNDSLKGRYLDSLSWTIDKSIPLKSKGFLFPRREEIYRDRRSFTDSANHLIKYTEYEAKGDTQTMLDYFFFENQPIKIKYYKRTPTEGLGAAYYFFSNGKLILSDSAGLLDSLNAEILYSNAQRILTKHQKSTKLITD